MLVVLTTEDPADPICELISTEQPLGLCDFAFAINPLGLDRIEPRALGRHKAGNYAHPSFATTFVFDSAVVGADPASQLSAFVPGGTLSQIRSRAFLPLCLSLWQHQERNCVVMALTGLPSTNLKANSVRALAHTALSRRGPSARDRPSLAPSGGGASARPPRTRNAETASGSEKTNSHPGSREPTPEWALGHPDQPISIPFFRAYSGWGLSIQRLARSQRTPSLASVARMVSPVMRLSVMPSSKLASAAIASVQKVPSLPNSLGRWWSISAVGTRPCLRRSSLRRRGALWDARSRASRQHKAPLVEVVDGVARRLGAAPEIFGYPRGARSRRALAKRIWQRRRTKAGPRSATRSPEPRARALKAYVRRWEVSWALL
jgi:hypothetical protein